MKLIPTYLIIFVVVWSTTSWNGQVCMKVFHGYQAEFSDLFKFLPKNAELGKIHLDIISIIDVRYALWFYSEKNVYFDGKVAYTCIWDSLFSWISWVFIAQTDSFQILPTFHSNLLFFPVYMWCFYQRLWKFAYRRHMISVEYWRKRES